MVAGNIVQLARVLENLAWNAVEAMPNGGNLSLSAENVVLNEKSSLLIPDGRAGKFVSLRVKDDGIGIQPENVNKIFVDGFTTKEQGTGKGLATVCSIVKAHNGFIQITTQVGQGSEFLVYLPAFPSGVRKIS
jgi:signal transduction histidine kinase